MPFTTWIAIYGHASDIDPTEIYDYVRGLVRTPADAPRSTDWHSAPTPGVSYLYTEPGSGADAWVVVRHARGGRLPAALLDDHRIGGDWSVIVELNTDRHHPRGPQVVHAEVVHALIGWADDRWFDMTWTDDEHRGEWLDTDPGLPFAIHF